MKLYDMRKYLLEIGIILVLFSCSKGDDISIEDRDEALFGQWEYEAIDSDTAVDINGDGTVNIDLYNTNEIRQCLKDNLTFFCCCCCSCFFFFCCGFSLFLFVVSSAPWLAFFSIHFNVLACFAFALRLLSTHRPFP